MMFGVVNDRCEAMIKVAIGNEPLIGMSLLYGYDLRIQAIEGGTVTIESLGTKL